jgi:hypothetical protein
MSKSARGTASRTDDDTPITAEVPLKISECVQRIGTAVGVRLPIPNDEDAAHAQELYVAKAVRDAAEERYQRARGEVLLNMKVPNVKGKHIVHDSSTAIVTADNRSNPRRLSEEAVLNLLVKLTKLSVEEAKQRIDECKLGGDGFQTHFSVVLK